MGPRPLKSDVRFTAYITVRNAALWLVAVSQQCVSMGIAGVYSFPW